MIALFATLGNSYQQLMSAYTKTELGLGGGGLGMMLAITGVGAVLGAAAVTAAGDAFPKGQALLLAVAADGVFLIGLGAFAHVASAIPILVGVGMSSACVIALGNVILQRISSDQYRGRVMSLYFLMFGMQPLGSLPAGAVAEAIGLRPTFAISGALIIVATAWMAARSPHLRRL
jgi:MFS family permease